MEDLLLDPCLDIDVRPSVAQEFALFRQELAELRAEVARLRRENLELRQQAGYWQSRHADAVKRFEQLKEELGLKEFLVNRSLSGDIAPEELKFLRGLRVKGKRPTPLYYYRELQNLRDPLHFRVEPQASMRKLSGGAP